MLRSTLSAALLLASGAIAQCTIGTTGSLVTPSPVDGWTTIRPIGFAFPFAGTTYTDLYITDHSMLSLSNAGTPAAPPAGAWVWNPTTANFTGGYPLIAPYWSDHTDGGAIGSIHIDNTSGTHCTVTWLNMQTYFALTPAFTVQVTLYPDGRIVMCLDNRVSNNGSTFGALNAIIGVADGVGPLPAASDISASPISAVNTLWEEWVTTAANTPNPNFDAENSTITLIPTNPGWICLFDTLACASNATYGAGCHGLGVSSNNPRIGTNWVITTTGINLASPVAVTFFGLSRQVPAIPLPFLGVNAPGCDVNIAGLIADVSAVNVGGTSALTIGIPNRATLKDASLTFQSGAFAPGANPENLAVSNGGEAVVGW